MDLSHIEWRKATKTTSNGGNCVEVARNLRGIVAVRDSKNPDGPKIVLTPAGWQTFTARVRAGEHDLA
jgi:hypothetical protein